MSEEEQNPRDTHFAKFASLLLAELLAVDDGRIDVSTYNMADDDMMDKYGAIVARRAYDLVHHTLLNASIRDLDCLTTEECVSNIPDLTELPKEGGE